MRVYASMDATTPLGLVPAYVARVEALGFDGVHVPETVHDAFMVALLAVEHSTTLTVRTSVAVAFPRSPMVVAYAAWDLARLSGGRFSLGLGTQVRGNIEGRYSTAWTEPVPRMRDYVGSLRAIWKAFQTGDALDFRSGSYSFTRLQPYFNPGPQVHPDIPVFLGGVNAGMCALAGEIADGLVTHPTAALPEALDRIRQDVRAGEQAAGRTAGQVAVLASAQFVSGIDAASMARNREAKRSAVAFLYSTPAYRGTLALLGREDLADQLHSLSRTQSWTAMAEVVDDEMLDAIAPTAPYADLAAVLSQRYAGRADGLVLAPPADPADDAAFAGVVAELRAHAS
ncbi:MAG: TIGR03617 family F420-dependent LLM class oxidoreductase [Frankiaceae bacterium]|nr:TIGR03617 family F420-dependent LLM class oxidoreductase [Frankiaceae bacterium]